MWDWSAQSISKIYLKVAFTWKLVGTHVTFIPAVFTSSARCLTAYTTVLPLPTPSLQPSYTCSRTARSAAASFACSTWEVIFLMRSVGVRVRVLLSIIKHKPSPEVYHIFLFSSNIMIMINSSTFISKHEVRAIK